MNRDDFHLTQDPLIEARARIIWGDSAAEVQEYLVSTGMSEEFARACVNNVMVERISIVRGEGISRIVRGLLYIIGSVAYLYFIAAMTFAHGIMITLKLFNLMAVVAIFAGLWLIYKGIGYVLKANRQGDLSKLGDGDDPIETIFDD